MTTLTAGTEVRYYGTGRLANRTAKAVVREVEGHKVTLEAASGNVFTIDITRIKF